MQKEDANRHYSTAEIALTMIIVLITLVIPTIAGAIYYFWWL